jgi:hypothetical protein
MSNYVEASHCHIAVINVYSYFNLMLQQEFKMFCIQQQVADFTVSLRSVQNILEGSK